ncbi:hypothetical protein [Actinocorallia populi]|uniref:hypothetical protein n=1 Tax=Actinocorallia populi TaxID=2079200 RepID=UPI000D0880A2|nr:hypothetical protein [Actinocorallia populi]
MLLLAAVPALLLALVFWSVVVFALTGKPPEPLKAEFGMVGSAAKFFLISGSLLPVVPFAVWAVSRRPMGTAFSVLGRVRWGWLGVCMIPAGGYFAFTYGVILMVNALVKDEPFTVRWDGGKEDWASLAMMMLTASAYVILMELLRGWVIQAVGAYTLQRADGGRRDGFAGVAARVLGSPWPGIAATCLMSLAMLGSGDPAEMAGVVFMAVVYGWLMVKTGGVEAMIALQTVSFTGIMVVVAVTGRFGIAGEDEDAWYRMLPNLTGLVLFTVAVLCLSRLMNVATVTPPRAAPPYGTYQAGGLGFPAPKT